MNKYFYIVFISILIVIFSVGFYIFNPTSNTTIQKNTPPVIKDDLVNKTFIWNKSELDLNGEVITPVKKDIYTISFQENGKVRVGTDCNSGFGDYQLDNSKIIIANITSTEKYCPDSQEGIFYNELISAQSFQLDNEGNLIINFRIGNLFMKEISTIEQVNASVTNSLVGKEYRWLRTELKSNKVILPITQGKFILTFSEDLKFTSLTDCNTNGGNYSLKEDKITFTDFVATRMYCENSQEEIFIRDLQKTVSFELLPDETLILNLPNNSGRMYFR